MMETNKKEGHILESIRELTDKAKKSKLSDKFFSDNSSEMKELANYFNTTPVQALLISSVLAYNFTRGPAGIDDLSDFYDCNPLLLLEYKSDLDHLLKRGILKKVVSRRKKGVIGLSNVSFYIPEDISDSIMSNSPVVEPEPVKLKDVFDLLESIYTLGWDMEDEDLSTNELIESSMDLIKEYSDFTLVKNIKRFDLSAEDQIMMFFLFWRYVNGSTENDLEFAINGILKSTRQRFEYSKGLLLGEHPLIHHGLVEILKKRFLEDTDIKLTNKSINIMMSDDIKLLMKKEKREDIILPDEIKDKSLIYGHRESIQLHQLRQSLSSDNLLSIQERMKTKGLPIGFTILFYGAPGTGKTESVYQLARETGREIMFIDISKLKSSWFGESQKLIKKTFTEYYNFQKESKLCPILLFNEADGIFSKRKDVGSSNVAQTENAIQNIILQEIETFSGILIATTNLISNFDKAFERRFLYKIEFSKPDCTIRSQIWRLKLPDLSEREALTLAEQFDFSGGQIDNIVRKFEINGIIEKRKPKLKDLVSFCNEENFDKPASRQIGY